MKLTSQGKGKSFSDRELAGKVRTLTLEHIYKYLQGDDEVFRREIILKLSGSILPRLNELSGPDGKPIPIFGNVPIDNSDQENTPTKETP